MVPGVYLSSMEGTRGISDKFTPDPKTSPQDFQNKCSEILCNYNRTLAFTHVTCLLVLKLYIQ